MTTFAEGPSSGMETGLRFEPGTDWAPEENEVSVGDHDEAVRAAKAQFSALCEQYADGLQPGQEGFVWPAKPFHAVALGVAQRRVVEAQAEVYRRTPLNLWSGNTTTPENQ